MNISWADVASYALFLGIAFSYLLMLDHNWIRFSGIWARFWAAYYLLFGIYEIGYGLYYFIFGHNETVRGIVDIVGGVLYLFIAWELWKRSNPPRRKRHRVRNALRRRFGRLVPVPVTR